MNDKRLMKFLLTGDFYSFFLPRIFFIIVFTIVLTLSVLLGFYSGSIILLFGIFGYLFISYTKWSKAFLFNQPNSSTLFRDLKDTKLTRMLFILIVVLAIVLLVALFGMAYFACGVSADNCNVPWLYNLFH